MLEQGNIRRISEEKKESYRILMDLVKDIQSTLVALNDLKSGTDDEEWYSYKREIENEVKEKILNLLNNPKIKSSFTDSQIFKAIFSRIEFSLTEGGKQDVTKLLLEHLEDLNSETFITLLGKLGTKYFVENDRYLKKLSNLDEIFINYLYKKNYFSSGLSFFSKLLENLSCFKRGSIKNFIEFLVQEDKETIQAVLANLSFIKEYLSEQEVIEMFINSKNIEEVFKHSNNDLFSQINFDSTFAERLISLGKADLIFTYKSDSIFKDIEFNSSFAKKLIDNNLASLVLKHKSQQKFADVVFDSNFLNELTEADSIGLAIGYLYKFHDLDLENAIRLLNTDYTEPDIILKNLNSFKKNNHQQILQYVLKESKDGISSLFRLKIQLPEIENIDFDSTVLKLVFENDKENLALENLSIFKNLDFDDFIFIGDFKNNNLRNNFCNLIIENLSIFKISSRNQIADWFVKNRRAEFVVNNLDKFNNFEFQLEHLSSIIKNGQTELIFIHRDLFEFVEFNQEFAQDIVKNNQGYLIFRYMNSDTFNNLNFDNDFAYFLISNNQANLVYEYRMLFKDFIFNEDFLLKLTNFSLIEKVIREGLIPGLVLDDSLFRSFLKINVFKLERILYLFKNISLESGLDLLKNMQHDEHLVLVNINSFVPSAQKQICLNIYRNFDLLLDLKKEGKIPNLAFDLDFMKKFIESRDVERILDENLFHFFTGVSPNAEFANLLIEMGYAEIVIKYRIEDVYFTDLNIDSSLIEKIIRNGQSSLIFENQTLSGFINDSDFANLMIETEQANELLSLILKYPESFKSIKIDDVFLDRLITEGKLNLIEVDFTNKHLREITTSNKIRYILEILSQVNNKTTLDLRQIILSFCLRINENEVRESLDYILNILQNNHLPTFVVRFKIFEYLFLLKGETLKYSEDLKSLPIIGIRDRYDLNLKLTRHIIFRDLMRISVYSNDQNLRDYLGVLKEGQDLINKFERGDDLSDSETEVLDLILSRIVTIYESSKISQRKKSSTRNDEIETKIRALRQDLIVPEGKTISDRLLEMFFKPFGVSSIDELLEYMQNKVKQAEARNVSRSLKGTLSRGWALSHGTGIEGLRNILQQGNLPREFRGNGEVDYTPFFVDLSQGDGNEFGKRLSDDYGKLTILYFNEGQYVFHDETNTRKLMWDLDTYEIVKGSGRDHVGIRTGLPSTEIGAIQIKEPLIANQVFSLIANNQFYIPIIDSYGKVIFSYQDYLRYKVDNQVLYQIVTSEDFNQSQLIEFFSKNPYLSDQSTKYFTGLEHFERFFANSDLTPTLFTKEVYRLFIILRDKTLSLPLNILSGTNLSSRDKEILQELLQVNVLDSYFQGGSVNEATQKIRTLSKILGTSVEKVYNTLKVIYICDTAGTESSIDIFESTEEGESFIQYSHSFKELDDQLKTSLGIRSIFYQ